MANTVWKSILLESLAEKFRRSKLFWSLYATAKCSYCFDSVCNEHGPKNNHVGCDNGGCSKIVCLSCALEHGSIDEGDNVYYCDKHCYDSDETDPEDSNTD